MQSVYQDIDNEEPPEPNSNREYFPPRGMQALSPHQLAEWRWANVVNLDIFLQKVYDYYNYRGFYCILLARTLQMATVAFVVWFGTYIYRCIDYTRLRHAASFSEARVPRCLAQTSWAHYISLWAFSVVWILKLFQYIGDVRYLWEMHEFYHHLLRISENEIQTISWQQVVDRLVNLQSMNGATRKQLDAHEIVNRIMRRENYMIALYNKNVLDLKVEFPFQVGTTEFLTKILEWSVAMCLDDYVFNSRGHVRSIVLKESKRDLLAHGLRRRFQFAAIMNVILAPLAVLYTTTYYFFRYFNEYYSSPKALGSRQYTPLAEWRFRELNELYHLFRRRLSMSELPAQRYISQFPRYKTELVLKFVIFVLSSFAAVLVVLSVYDPELLSLDMKLYLTSLGLAIVVARAMLSVPQEQAIYQPEASMRQIIEFTHYCPDHWESRLHTEPVKTEFCTLYDLKPKIIAREILSVVLNPIILGFKLADRSERIIDFFREFSINVDELGGQVCSLAVFNTDRVAKVKERSDALDRFYATQDGKMLKSYLNFMDVYGAPQMVGSYSHHSQASLPHMPPSPSFARSSQPPAPQTTIKYKSSFDGRRPVPAPSSAPHAGSAGSAQVPVTGPAPIPGSAPGAVPGSAGPAPGPIPGSAPGPTSGSAPAPSHPGTHPGSAGPALEPATPYVPGYAAGYPPGHSVPMESSVMYQYEQLRHDLPTIQEGSKPSSSSNSELISNADTNDDDDERFAKDGVIGLLNNLYKK